MGKKGPNKKTTCGSHSSVALGEESSGKKQTHVKTKSMLKLEHIKNLAVWASGEASIPSLGAFFGHRLASCAEAIGRPPDPSLFPCHRCESILQPGYNCTVRIEKNRTKGRRRFKKPITSTENNVVYNCHFCLHRNMKRGTPIGHKKQIRPQKAKPPSSLEPANSIINKPTGTETVTTGNIKVKKTDGVALKAKPPSTSEPVDSTVNKTTSSENLTTGNVQVNKTDEVALPEIVEDDSATNSPMTLVAPSPSTGLTLLEAKRRKRNKSGSKKPARSKSSPGTTVGENTLSTLNKRKRKSWTSLKEIAESSEHDNTRNFANLRIPFFL